MQKISIETTQNVKIDYILAGVGRRIQAFFLDLLVIFSYFILLSLIFNYTDYTPGMAVNVMMIVPTFLYHLLCEIFLNGQSIGKKQMKIKVIRLDGNPPTIGAYLIRWLLRPIDITLFFGSVAIIAIAISSKDQRLGDLAAGTTVVKVDAPAALPVFAISDDYQPVYENVIILNDADVEVLQRVLQVYRESGNMSPVMATVKKMETTLQINNSMPPLKFLFTIIKDYKYLTSR